MMSCLGNKNIDIIQQILVENVVHKFKNRTLQKIIKAFQYLKVLKTITVFTIYM